MRFKIYVVGKSAGPVHLSEGQRVSIGAAAPFPFDLQGCGRPVYATLDVETAGVRVSCVGSVARGLWVATLADDAELVVPEWLHRVDHDVLWESVAVETTTGTRHRHLRAARRYWRQTEQPWSFVWLSAGVIPAPSCSVIVRRCAKVMLPGMSLWLAPTGAHTEEASRQRGVALGGNRFGAVNTLDELVRVLDDGSGGSAAFETDSQGAAWRVIAGRAMHSAPWRCPSSRGDHAEEAHLDEHLVRNLRGSDPTGYLPMVLDREGRAFALVTTRAAQGRR